MGFFRFRRSIKILPGVRWNFNKGGSSFTFGGRGLKHTIGNKGSRTTVGLPGTGISYTTVHKNAPPSQPPPLPMAKSKISRYFYFAGAVVLGVWMLSKCSDSASSSRSSASYPTPQPRVAISETLERSAPSEPTVPLYRVPVATPVPAPPPRRRSQSDTSRIQKYVPSEVTLTESLGFPVVDKGQNVGVSAVRKGTNVRVIKVSGDKLVLDYNGSTQTVPITSTDFLERVIAEAEK